MITNADKDLAQRALSTLRSAADCEPPIALNLIRPLRRSVGISTLDDPPDRAEAWLAICFLHDALEKQLGSEIAGQHWKEAIAHIERWIAAVNEVLAPRTVELPPTAAARIGIRN